MEKKLPSGFLRSTELLFGAERFARFMDAMDAEPVVSIRLNPGKVVSAPCGVQCLGMDADGGPTVESAALTDAAPPAAEHITARVPWCDHGFYLSERPAFTFDPLLHAGCYYVQEAASQFIVHCARFALQRVLGSATYALDLCAAPGGKSTALRTVLPPGCLLVSNEPMRPRAQVLSENIQKWGHDNCLVTSNYAVDFARGGLKELFGLIVCDVPCSGEGMFRKDPASVGEWSPENVARCQRLQRQIVSDIWPCLAPGGIMIYSTCTYNMAENEENLRWLQEQTGASIVGVPTLSEWGITGSLLPAFSAPVYRFIPGLTRSEGLFMAMLRKPGEYATKTVPPKAQSKVAQALARLSVLHTSYAPVAMACTAKGSRRTEAPSCAEALALSLRQDKYPMAELSYPSAIAYLRHEAIALPPETPRGYVVVTFRGHPLGFVKNVGPRANNLYPREWAIRSSHAPESYTAVSKMLIL